MFQRFFIISVSGGNVEEYCYGDDSFHLQFRFYFEGVVLQGGDILGVCCLINVLGFIYDYLTHVKKNK